MAIEKFVPEVWVAALLVALEKALVYAGADVVNRDYEGDISAFGDTVHITSLVDPTIGTYAAHTDIAIEDVTDIEQLLLINQAKYFAFEVDDIEKRQAKGDVLNEQARRAAYKLRDIADQYVATLMAANVAPSNRLAKVTLATPAAAYDKLVDLSTALDEADVPTEGRFAVVTPKFHGLLQKDERFIAAGDQAGVAARENGHIGRAAGLGIKLSNNAPSGAGGDGGKHIIAGSKIATTFAEQIAKVEAFKMEKRFNEALKGLHLYGSKVVRPTALAAVEVVI